MRWRSVVCSSLASLAEKLPGSLAVTAARLLKMSPFGAGWSSVLKRRKMFLVRVAASSPCNRPVLALPAGTAQKKVGSAAPGANVTFTTEHSDGALQTALDAPVVSQTKRMRFAAGGVIASLMRVGREARAVVGDGDPVVQEGVAGEQHRSSKSILLVNRSTCAGFTPSVAGLPLLPLSPPAGFSTVGS